MRTPSDSTSIYVAGSSRIRRSQWVDVGTRSIPLYAANWTRQDCLDYLHDLFGVWWPNPYCRQRFIGNTGCP